MRNFIDKDMILVKLTYLLWGGLVATYSIYLNPFYVSIGIPRSKAGVITGVPFAVSAIAAPLWGLLTDYTGRQRFILVILCLCSAVWVSSLPLIANVVAERAKIINSITYHNSTTMRTMKNTTFISMAAINDTLDDSTIVSKAIVNATRTFHPNNSLLPFNVSSEFTERENPITNGDTMFYTFFAVMALGSVFFSCIGGYVEALALKAIKVSPNGATYGGQRVCGSLGACVITYFTGVLLDNFPINNLSEFSILFFSYPIFPLLLIPVGVLLINQHDSWTKVKKSVSSREPLASDTVEDSKSIRNQLFTVIFQPDFIVLLLTAFVAGLSFGMIFFKMFLFNEQLNISKTKLSFAFSIGSFSNIVMFPFTSWFIKLLRGPIPTIIFGLFAYCVRHVLMSYTTTYWVMILLQGLSGFSFGSLWASFMNHVHDVAPSKIKTTMIVLVQSIHFGLGCFLCNAVGGVLYEMSDAKTLFRWNGVMCGVWGCLLIVFFGIRSKQKKATATPVPVLTDPLVDAQLCQLDKSGSCNLLNEATCS